MIIHNMEQGSEEWHKVRSFRLTASNAQAISACGAGLKSYIIKILGEQIYGHEDLSDLPDIKRGNELEPLARLKYELEKKCEVQEVGFVSEGQYIGCSPDGLVGDDGGVEIKARNNEKHLALILGGPIEAKQIWQIQACLMITKRKWWDAVSYNPNFKQSLHIKRFKPDPKAFEKLEKGFSMGTEILKNYLKNANLQIELH